MSSRVVGVGSEAAPRSHAEIAAAIEAYASGVLTGRAEAAVRRHLTHGCRECLEALFRHPIGLPRDRLPAEPPGAGAWSVVAAVLVVIALTGTVLASTMWLGGRRTPHHGSHARDRRVTALEGRVAAARERLASLSARATVLESDIGSLTSGSGAGGATSERLARTSSRHASRGRFEEARALGRLGSSLAGPATRIERLRSEGAAGVRGWIVWDPLRRRLFVYAVGLPRLARAWEARVAVGDDVRRAPLGRLSDGGVWAALEPVADGECIADVSIVPPAGDRVVLRGAVGVCAPRPAA